MMISLRTLLIGLAIAAACGAGVFWLGPINIGASTGHWSVTNWVLHTAMRRSVQARADAKPPASFPSEAMIRRGAGHFESGCAPCHGSPAAERSAVIGEMTPEPPGLADRVDQWASPELFWIVKHGVKMTGMPAWPARNRDDEIWSLVAFLETLPTLDRNSYRQLAYGSSRAGEGTSRSLSVPAAPALADCIRCHGTGGRGEDNGAFPRLDIQNEPYLYAALLAYADGERSSGIMQEAVSGLTDSELKDLATHFAEQPLHPGERTQKNAYPAQLLKSGEKIAQNGIPKDNIAACTGCHGGTSRAEFPNLSGQYSAYLESQLRLFADDEKQRGGSHFSNLMQEASHALKEEDIKAVAAWYASQLPKTASSF